MPILKLCVSCPRLSTSWIGYLPRVYPQANVLINDSGEAVLSDFGTSKILGSTPSDFTTPNVGYGTTRWISREVLAGEECTVKSDIWSLGMLILGRFFLIHRDVKAHHRTSEVITGEAPYPSIRRVKYEAPFREAILKKRQLPSRDEYQPYPSALDPYWELLQECWRWEPEDRPSAVDVLDRCKSAARTAVAVFDTRSLSTGYAPLGGPPHLLLVTRWPRSPLHVLLSQAFSFLGCDNRFLGVLAILVISCISVLATVFVHSILWGSSIHVIVSGPI